MNKLDHEAERKLFLQTKKVDRFIAAEFNRIISQISPLIAADVVKSVLDREMNRILLQAAQRVQVQIEGGIKQAWDIANERTWHYLDKRVIKWMDISDDIKKVWYDPNEKALQQYIARERNGLNLSQRIWKPMEQIAELSAGIERGQSAASVARELRKQLVSPTHNPDSKPGQGVYKSPIKNAQRLARTEINIANRTADDASWAKNPTILGYEIRVSDTTNKNVKARCPICLGLAGNYPSTFKWGGWHPHCLCYKIPIIMPREFIREYNRLIAQGTDTPEAVAELRKRAGVIDSIPSQTKQYMITNKEKLDRAKTKPYWVVDNALM